MALSSTLTEFDKKTGQKIDMDKLDAIKSRNTPYIWRGGIIGLSVITGWAVNLIFMLTGLSLTSWTLPFHLALQVFFNTGLFIVAHDAIHQSLLPKHRKINNFIGGLAFFLYGGFLWEKMRTNHLAHHTNPVSDNDPDYALNSDERFFPWLWSFMVRYYSWTNYFLMYIHVGLAWFISGSFLKMFIMFAIPTWLSALQLFIFGIYLPHKTPKGGHKHPWRAVTLDYPVWLSFITCYHFGYHQEHHDHPHLPWWRLPIARRINKRA